MSKPTRLISKTRWVLSVRVDTCYSLLSGSSAQVQPRSVWAGRLSSELLSSGILEQHLLTALSGPPLPQRAPCWLQGLASAAMRIAPQSSRSHP